MASPLDPYDTPHRTPGGRPLVDVARDFFALKILSPEEEGRARYASRQRGFREAFDALEQAAAAAAPPPPSPPVVDAMGMSQAEYAAFRARGYR